MASQFKRAGIEMRPVSTKCVAGYFVLLLPLLLYTWIRLDLDAPILHACQSHSTEASASDLTPWIVEYHRKYSPESFEAHRFDILQTTAFLSTKGPLPSSFFAMPVERHVSIVIQSYLRHFHMHRFPSGFPSHVVALDLGANAGYFSTLMGSTGITVHAYDPSPDCCALVGATAALNGFSAVHIHNAGISSREYEFDAPRKCDENFTPRSGQGHAQDAVRIHTQRVGVMEPGVECLVAKIDTEGSEVDILDSLRDSWKDIRVLVIEMAPHVWPAKGYTTEQGVKILDDLLGMGYRFYPLTDTTNLDGLVEPCSPPLRSMPTDVPWRRLKGPTTLGFIQRLLSHGTGYNVLVTDTRDG